MSSCSNLSNTISILQRTLGAVGVFVLFPMPEPFDVTVPLKQSLMRIKVHSQPSKLYTYLCTSRPYEILRNL